MPIFERIDTWMNKETVVHINVIMYCGHLVLID